MFTSRTLCGSVSAAKAVYRRLGSSGFRVSVPILGGMSIGNPAWAPWILDEDKSLELLKTAYDNGVTTWDTANVYSNGDSERLIGTALKKFQIPRSKVQILTKCGGAVGEEPGFRTHEHIPAVRQSRDYVNKYGLSRAAILESVDASLERLQTRYIDLLHIHRFDPDTPIEETMRALHDLVQSDKVRYIGASSMWTYQFALLQFAAERHGWTKFISMQNRYNLLYREEEREMIKFCQHTGVGVIPYAPIANGSLARPLAQYGNTLRSSQWVENPGTYYSEAERNIISRVEDVAHRRGWTMSQVALSWVQQKSTSPIIGLSAICQLHEALAINSRPLSEQEMDYLEKLYQPVPIQGHS